METIMKIYGVTIDFKPAFGNVEHIRILGIADEAYKLELKIESNKSKYRPYKSDESKIFGIIEKIKNEVEKSKK